MRKFPISQSFTPRMPRFMVAIFQHTYAMVFLIIVLFFALFTLCGIFGLLPSTLQASIQPHYVAILPHSLVGNADSDGDAYTVGGGTSDATEFASGLASAAAAASISNDPTDTRESAPLVYTPDGQKELPQKIVFASLKKEVKVYNPVSAANSVLTSYLLKGATRYPGSASLDEKGNVFIFGHSAGSFIVRNQAYTAFTGIEKLLHGEEISVYGPSTVYVYRVRNVVKVKSYDAAVNLEEKDRVLTLSTCNLLGAKEDRFLLTADFVRSYPINSNI